MQSCDAVETTAERRLRFLCVWAPRMQAEGRTLYYLLSSGSKETVVVLLGRTAGNLAIPQFHSWCVLEHSKLEALWPSIHLLPLGKFRLRRGGTCELGDAVPSIGSATSRYNAEGANLE